MAETARTEFSCVIANSTKRNRFNGIWTLRGSFRNGLWTDLCWPFAAPWNLSRETTIRTGTKRLSLPVDHECRRMELQSGITGYATINVLTMWGNVTPTLLQPIHDTPTRSVRSTWVSKA